MAFHLDTSKLRPHQRSAIQVSVANGFRSGVHFHATGTGKSWVAFHILMEFIQYYKATLVKSHASKPKKAVIFWICERKNILHEQFSNQQLKERGFLESLYGTFQVIDFCQHKNSNWQQSLHAAQFWPKPILLIINRAFLSSKERYKEIRVPIDLVLHDECHSISNKSTQLFYKWLLEVNHPQARCIGFSATPYLESLEENGKHVLGSLNPYTAILSRFSIYNACMENDVIVPPKIERFEVQPNPTRSLGQDTFLNPLELATLIQQRIRDQPYKKIVVWTGMIKLCRDTLHVWKKVFPDYYLAVDTSLDDTHLETFYNLTEKGILFCASKHREGSDIPFLDTCVFLDYVESRGHQVFVQCVGRVLRKDALGKKKHGLIIDVKAKSTLNLCDRLSKAFQLPDDVFPWVRNHETTMIHDKEVMIHTLTIQKQVRHSQPAVGHSQPAVGHSQPAVGHSHPQAEPEKSHIEQVSKTALVSRFVRQCPSSPDYTKRLNRELKLIIDKNIGHYLLQALDILEMIQDKTLHMPHVTRGSCGSSLVCYLLGISHIDPIKYHISFARFLNENRENLPDVDFDFPYHQRDEIFLQLQEKWPGKIARISNHVHYHEKSARREAMRRAGIRGFISKHDLYDKKMQESWSQEVKQKVESETKHLLDTFRCYSLHCGGIVYYEEGIPQDHVMRDKDNHKKYTTIRQVKLDKREVSTEKRFKIDILSSRGLAQLMDIQYACGYTKHISFDASHYIGAPATQELLARGDNMGITLAESTLMRNAFVKFKPKTLHDMAICLAIVRPAASQAKQTRLLEEAETYLIFDDDAIHMIRFATGCKEAEADRLRRMLSKPQAKTRSKAIQEITEKHQRYREKTRMSGHNMDAFPDLEETLTRLEGLQKYSFCKSHAYSYAQLVWYLAHMKAHHPKEFWKATLQHCKSQYRSWVHKYEAHRVGVHYWELDMPSTDVSIWKKSRAQQNRTTLEHEDLSQTETMKKMGIWNLTRGPRSPGDFFPNCYARVQGKQVHFRGIIASMRTYRNQYCTLLIGVEAGRYLEIGVPKTKLGYIPPDAIGVYGHGILDKPQPMGVKLDKVGRIHLF